MAIFDPQGNPANTFFGPIMSAVDLMTQDAIRQREGEKEKEFRREYWNKQDQRRKEDQDIQAKRDKDTKVFQFLTGVSKDPDFTKGTREKAADTIFSSLLGGGEPDLASVGKPQIKPGKTQAVTDLIKKYYPKAGEVGEQINEDTWKILDTAARAQEKSDKDRIAQNNRSKRTGNPEVKDDVLREINMKLKGAQELSKGGSQNARIGKEGEINYGKTPVDRVKYAKYVKIMDDLHNKREKGNWTEYDQQYLDNLKDYDYYESANMPIPEYGSTKPVEKKKKTIPGLF